MGGSGSSIYSLIILLVVFGGIFYFLLIRPQRKKQQEHKDLVSNLAVGDVVISAGGIHGEIKEVKETTFTIEVQDGTILEIEKDSIAEKETKESMPEKEETEKEG